MVFHDISLFKTQDSCSTAGSEKNLCDFRFYVVIEANLEGALAFMEVSGAVVCSDRTGVNGLKLKEQG